MNNLVRQSKADGVFVITVDNPPVNALSPGVPEGISQALDAAATDASVSAVVLVAAGKTFIAGADIKELQAAAFRAASHPTWHPCWPRLKTAPSP